MRIEDLNWMDVEEYLKHDDRLILVLGTIEQHGYLSLATDVKIPMALADAASVKTGVLVAPPHLLDAIHGLNLGLLAGESARLLLLVVLVDDADG